MCCFRCTKNLPRQCEFRARDRRAVRRASVTPKGCEATRSCLRRRARSSLSRRSTKTSARRCATRPAQRDAPRASIYSHRALVLHSFIVAAWRIPSDFEQQGHDIADGSDVSRERLGRSICRARCRAPRQVLPGPNAGCRRASGFDGTGTREPALAACQRFGAASSTALEKIRGKLEAEHADSGLVRRFAPPLELMRGS